LEKIVHILIIAVLSAAIGACTSARWTVKEKSAIDQDDYEIMEQTYFLKPADEITPQNPVFKLDLYSERTYEYTQRVLVHRNIQEYKLRPGFLALGLGGAGMAFYLANSNTFTGNSTTEKSITLNAVGVLLAASGFLNMEPVGEPRPTGEERYLRSSGTAIQTDTIQTTDHIDATASVTVQHNDEVIFEETNRQLSNGELRVSLAGKFNELQLSGPKPGSITIEVNFEDSTYNYQYSIDDVLQPYARITSQLTELRNSPEEISDNVLADLMQGSQLPIQDTENEEWYQVLYGIAENYVKKEDVEIIWRSTDFVGDDQVMTVPRIPFGNIDVESNIPILRGENPNAIGLIVTNENYSGNLAARNYAHRDGRLIKTYLTNALGYQEQNISELSDFSNGNEVLSKLSEIRSVSDDSTELFVYLSGYGSVGTDDGIQLQFLGISNNSDDPPAISLRKIFEQIALIPSSKTVVLSDIDFSAEVSPTRFTANEAQNIIELNAIPLTNSSQTSLLMGTRLSHPSNLYFSSNGEDKKHHIFPYYFSKALQERKTTMSAIYQYLERNISYTARKLHDRPQDPLLIGSTSLDLVSE
jgi:hypothetical protein